MQRPESHRTAYEAERIFLSALPASWVPRKQDPDYGIDFRVEVFEHGRSTGFHCAVQVRGSRSLTTSTDTIRSRLATRHLQQFVEIERQPVFLVVVDVVRKEAFWIFVQEWEAKFRRRETWRSQKTVTITIPAANRLSDFRLFQQALRHADTFMATRKTEAVTDAITDSAAALKAAKRIQRSTGSQSVALRQRSRFAVLTVDQAGRIRIPLNLVPWVVIKRSFRHLFPLSFLYGPKYYGPLDAWAIADLHGDAEEFNGLPPSDWFISPATLSARATDDPNAALLSSLIFELELYRHSNGVRLTIPGQLREIGALPSRKGKVIVFKHASVISIRSLDAYRRSVHVAAADATS